MHMGLFSLCFLHICGCPIGQGPPCGQAQNWMGENCKKALILGSEVDLVRRAWHQEKPGVSLFCSHAGQTAANQRYTRYCFPGLCSSQSPCPSAMMVLCTMGALSEGCGYMDRNPTVPTTAALRAKRQQSSHMCSQRTLTGHLLSARLRSGPGVVSNPTGCGVTWKTSGRGC